MREHLSDLDLTQQSSFGQNCLVMPVQRRLSTAFAAAGHPALRPIAGANLANGVAVIGVALG